MLSKLIELEQKNLGAAGAVDDKSHRSNRTYVDFSSGLTVKTRGFAANASAVESQQILFGNDQDNGLIGSDAGTQGEGDALYGGAGNDYMDGKDGADYLEGNTGDDTLDGGKGNDTLVGGKGNDTYILRASDGGIDTITDAGGEGLIKVIAADGSETVLGSSSIEKLSNSTNTWQSEDKRFRYTTNVEADGSTTLKISGAGVSAVVKNFTSGNLGITLPGSVSTPSNPTTGQQILGDLAPADTDPATEGVQIQYDALGNVITVANQPEVDRADTLYDSANDDEIIAGGGDDHVTAARGGNDWIQAGSGRDTVDAGMGNDLIELGTERDYGVGGGADMLYADARRTVDELLAQSIAAADDQADIMDGGSGDDTVMGDAGNDALFGGEGKDLLVGGAGDDYMFGDRGTTAVSSDWEIHQEILFPNEEVSPVALVVTGVGSQLASQEGEDLMLGGAGNDFMLANGGNDYLDGGSGRRHGGRDHAQELVSQRRLQDRAGRVFRRHRVEQSRLRRHGESGCG